MAFLFDNVVQIPTPNENQHETFPGFSWFDIRLGGRYHYKATAYFRNVLSLIFIQESSQVVVAESGTPVYLLSFDIIDIIF